ncbi:MAG: SpoIVB peptidase S55 domain-containing protein [Candidatus Wallbacteria bacterium]|nr:SpoIVB peptidase S55 domain-containing protein [Candidatus Wallbacteria bacterium]
MKALLFLIFLVLPFILHADSQDFISVSEVLPEMQGIAKTVFEGTAIQSFPIKVLGVLKNNKFSDNLVINGESVLIQASGPLIDKSGGIAAGMSGAPVYIKNRLLGALSAGWTLADHTVGLVTPIEDMMKLTYPPYMENGKSSGEVGLLEPPVKIKGKTYGKLELVRQVPATAAEGVLYFYYAGSPLMVQGLRSNLIKVAGQLFPVFPSATAYSSDKTKLVPGAALGVQIARGDINITTLGTLTYYDEQRNLILAFGHPFLHKGEVDYFLSDAYIYHSFSSIDMPFKVGSPLELIGRVCQDRQQGIVGLVGEKPRTIPVKFQVKDLDQNLTRQINVDIVSDTQLLSDVLNAMVKQALDETVNYIGPLSVESYFTIGYSVAGGSSALKYSNLYYSDNLSDTLCQDLLATVGLLTENEFKPVKIQKIDWQLSITKKKRTARITNVKFPSRNVIAGEVIGLNVTIKPFRANEFVKTVFLKLPEDTSGSLNVAVRGGKNYRSSTDDKENFGSFEEIVQSAEQYPKYNDIVVSWSVPKDEGDTGEIQNSAVEPAPNSSNKVISTEYVLDGYFENLLIFNEVH